MLNFTVEDGVADLSQDWLQELYWGGLMHVNSSMYTLMATMEVQPEVVLCQAGTQKSI